jgi:hypothetical protein
MTDFVFIFQILHFPLPVKGAGNVYQINKITANFALPSSVALLERPLLIQPAK